MAVQPVVKQKITTNLDDKRLIKQVLAGDAQAFDQFVDEYLQRLYRFSLSRMPDQPEACREVVHQTLSKALRKLSGYRGEAALFSWLCAICRNEIADWQRSQQRYRKHIVLTEDLPEVKAAIESLQTDVNLSPEAAFQRDEIRRLIQVALDQLPAKYGDALEWKYIEGYSVEEIASRLRVGREAAQSLLARARRSFGQVYSELVNPAVSAAQNPSEGK